MREGNSCNLGMSLGNINNLQSTYSLATLSAPEVDFLLRPSHIYVVVKILDEVFDFPGMPRVGQQLLHSKLERLLVEA